MLDPPPALPLFIFIFVFVFLFVFLFIFVFLLFPTFEGFFDTIGNESCLQFQIVADS